jgi:hypothetical protein
MRRVYLVQVEWVTRFFLTGWGGGKVVEYHFAEWVLEIHSVRGRKSWAQIRLRPRS